MPLLDYTCLECQKIWEEFIRAKEDIPDACIYCDSSKIRQAPTAPGGYKILGDNSCSTPRPSGSFKKAKD